MVFSDLEKEALEVFVTSAEDSIYAIRHTIPPEVFGAFGSYFSRNPKDFRVHLLNAIYGQIDEGKGLEVEYGKEYTKEGILNWILEHKDDDATAAIEIGLRKSRDFYKKWYGKFSHKSIANEVWIPMVATNISQLVAKELAYEQLAFFIEQSTRFVPWTKENMFFDSDVDTHPHLQKQVNNAIQTMTGAYHSAKDALINHYTKTIPFDSWLEWQSPQTLASSDKFKQAKYNREIQGAALDSARFLLPQAAKTNIAWISDARSMEFDIAAWKGHPIREIRDAAKLMEKHAGQIAPSLLKYTEENPYYGDKLRGYGEDLRAENPMPFDKGVDIISYDPKALDKTVAHLLRRHNKGGTFNQRYREVQKMSFNDKISILDRVTRDRGLHDEWVEMDEEFDLTNIVFEIRTDVGATRDLRRHQNWNRSEPLYTLDNGYEKPPVFDEVEKQTNLDLNETFESVMRIAHRAEHEIREAGLDYQAQYVIPMATRHPITFSGGLDQLQYMEWTRSTPQGNWSYRQDMFNLAEAVTRVHPWMLGYEHYPEGKSLEQAFKDAPLKNILRLQFGETALHI